MNHLPRVELCAARAMRVGFRNTSTRWGGYQFIDDKQEEQLKSSELLPEKPNPAANEEAADLKSLGKKILRNARKAPPKKKL